MDAVRHWLGRRIAFPLFMTVKSVQRRAGWRPVRQLRRFEALARAEPRVWREFRDRQLGRCLASALRHIPYYQPLADDLLPEVERDPMTALRQFPILTKRTMQEQEEALLAEPDAVPRGGRHESGTGGSTGEPTRFWHDHRRDGFRLVIGFRQKTLTGWQPGEPGALIESQRAQFWTISRVRRALNWLGNSYVGLNVHGMRPAANRAFLERMERQGPFYLRGIASGVHAYAQFLEAEGLADRARGLGLRAILSTCEPIFPPMRERIERVFGTRVFDLYACNEMGAIAVECPAHHGLHVAADTLVLEVLDEAGRPVPRGERGRIVCTDPWTLGASMIRIDVGDVGRYLLDDEPCPCGVTLPRLAPVEGRSIDFLTLPDGRRIWGTEFSKHLHTFPGVRQFRVEQDVPEEFRVLLVGDRSVIEPRLGELRAKAPPGVTLRVEFRERIPLTEAGKRLTVVSRVGRQ